MNDIDSKVLRFFKKHGSTILTILGAAGTIATAYLSAKGASKAARKLDSTDESTTMAEKVQLVWKDYIPASVIGIGSIICIFGANVISERSQATLMAAYTMLDQSYRQYRNSANSVYGDGADAKIQAQMATNSYVYENGCMIYDPDLDAASDKILCYDMISRRYFTSTFAAVLNAEYHINRNLQVKGEVSLNEFYEFLGLDLVEFGDVVWWDICEMRDREVVWLDFENSIAKMDDGMECCIVFPRLNPVISASVTTLW